MTNSTTVKKFFTSQGLNVRVSTVPCKAKWIQVRIVPSFIDARAGVLEYNQEFPLALRQAALRIIYPICESIISSGSAGNIRAHSMSMVPAQWETLVNQIVAISASLD